MVNLRSSSGVAVLLRIARLSLVTVRQHVNAPVSTIVQHKQQFVNSSISREVINHDLDLDLFAIHGRDKGHSKVNKSEPSAQSQKSHLSADLEPLERQSSSESSIKHTADVSPSNAPNAELNKGEILEVENSLDDPRPPVDSSDSSSTSGQTPIQQGGDIDGMVRSWNRTERGNLDPYLIQYLKSLHSKPKERLSHERSASQQDLDVEFLRPDDIRATYNIPIKKGESTPYQQPPAVESPPSNPGVIPEHIIDAGIQKLKLTTSGNKVIIPRSTLLRLIEQTITLSGAAQHGDDVIIERYSPTWHRFARLLRTSDLHKISKLESQKGTPTEQWRKAEYTRNGNFAGEQGSEFSASPGKDRIKGAGTETGNSTTKV
jgi:hypothetical protein